MSDNYDQLALSWVRKEINNTLDQARQGLENFAEDNQDQTQIQFCINCLHQVQGTLQMLDFSGAARLALEMEFLAEKMSLDPKFAIDSAFEVLMRAILQMPGYLERVEEGQKDVPIILLPLLNQLREASEQPPITEREVFSADTQDVAPPKSKESVSDSDKTNQLQENAKKLHAHYQKGLSGTIRGQNVKESLARIHKVLLRLEALTENSPLAKLWWIADGFIFSITERGLYKKPEVHGLLQQVEKHIVDLVKNGVAILNEKVDDNLLSQLLYYVARSKSKNARVVTLKQKFNLESQLADSEQIKERQAKLAKPDTSAVTNVAGALKEELASIKDQLDLFVRSQTKDKTQLQNFLNSLSRIADTLTLLELAIPRDVIRQQIQQIQKQIDMEQMPDDSLVMDIAGALLFVEANLKNISFDSPTQEEGEQPKDVAELSKAHAKEVQVDEATHALIKVARKTIQSAKDSIIGFIASDFDQKILSNVPALLEEVLGAMKIVQFDDASEILNTAKRYVDLQIVNQSQKPIQNNLDALADVITSVEYYLEASEEGKYRGLGSILKGAEASIATLIKAIQVFEKSVQDDQSQMESQTADAAESSNQADLEPIADEVLSPELSTAEPSTIESTASDAGTTEQQATEADSASTAPELAGVAKAQPQEPTPAAETPSQFAKAPQVKEIDESLIDDDVLEIFLEEVDEEIEAISQMLPRWINNVQDNEALTTLRRSFHTLKGSGRLVGASVIGEVSWAIENVLNKVIEETIPAEMPVISVLNEVNSMLPALIKAFSNKTSPECNYNHLMAKANHIAEGKSLNDFVFEEATTEELPEPLVEQLEQVEEPIDPLLLEIFSTEAATHLEIIEDYIESAPADGTIAVTDDLIRALHTLKGSAKMANVEAMAGLTGPLEKYARLIKGSGRRFEQAFLQFLTDCHAYLDKTLSDLIKSIAPDMEREQALLERLEEFSAGSAVATETTTAQRDQRFVSIFLTEGLDILSQVSTFNEQLSRNLEAQTLKESIRDELHAFYRGAEMLAIAELESIAKSADSLAEFSVTGAPINAEFCELITEAVGALEAMLNRIASEEDIASPQVLVDKIETWVKQASSAAIPQDMDVELVELFVEEGEELIESAGDLLARWKDNLTSKDITSELRRIYHTIKGSSRMAGAMNIGNLGFAAEDMFNTILDFNRSVSNTDYDITVAATEKLSLMIAELKSLRWPAEANDEINQIRRHLGEETEETVEIGAEQPAAYLETVSAIEFDAEREPELEPGQTETITELESVKEQAAEAELTMARETLSAADVTPSSEEQLEQLEESIAEEEVAEEEVVEEEIDEKEVELTETVEQPLRESQQGVLEIIAVDLDEDGEEVLEIYFEEAEELLMALDGALTQWSDNLSDKSAIDLLQRTLHTLKGGARLSDLSVLGSLAHEMETYFERINSGQVQPKAEDVNFFFKGYDVLAGLVKEVEEKRQMTVPTQYLKELVQLIKQGRGAKPEPVEAVELVEPTESVESTLSPQEQTVSDTEQTEELTVEPDFKSTAKQASKAETSVDTIGPSAPIVVSGDIHLIELDEDGEEVLEIYLEEAEELLITLDESLHDWAGEAENKEAIDLLQRTLHTLKGGARLSDLVVLGNLAHEMETYFERVNSGRLLAKPQDVNFLLQGYDVIAALVNEVKSSRQMTVPVTYMNNLLALIKGKEISVELESTEMATVATEEVSKDQQASADVISFDKKKQLQDEAQPKQAKSSDIIRVPSEQLEQLVNLAGETSIFRSRLEQQMSLLKYNLEEMGATVERLREQLRNLDIETDAQISYRKEISGGVEYEDFDPLEMDRYTRQQELTRGLSESAVDIMSLKETLDSMTADSETLLLQQGRVNTEMQESLMRTRMIPFESLVPRLRRMVRQISSELDKTIELSISADGEMDRSVLERLIAPLEHMLRNAMDHGIEPPQERKSKNKSETGRVKISLYRDGSEVFVKIQDDGRGLNLKAIRKKATERGLITDSSELTDHELQQLILEAGFSTAEKVTQISGRGVGMDVVSSEIKQMGGVIEIDSVEGTGSTFTIKLPFTVSVNHALMVQLGDEIFAIPLANIEGIVRVSPFELEEYYSNKESAFNYAGVDYSIYSLGQLLDHNAVPNLAGVTQPLPVLLLHGAEHPTALQIDGLLGSREIVVKSIGSQLSSISGLSGATILGDGRVVLILDMPALIRRIDAVITVDDGTSEFISAVEEVEDRAFKVMVVDDSITVRKVTSRLLERHDFEVITAKDGVDALSVLAENKPDVMLLDIEMPRMDGFELATIIRHDEALKDLPIIMITSRTGDKHRERAEQIGVEKYMGKPYNEVDLIDSITELLPGKV